MNSRIVLALTAFACLAIAGCRVHSLKETTVRTHEGVGHSFCADAGGDVQVNIGPCTIAGFPFFVSLSSPGHYESQAIRDGEQKRFGRKLKAGECADVSIVNMDDGSLGAPTCDFHIYWDLE